MNMSEVKDKIAKLLALADSPNEHEAQAALLKARELMARHKLRPEEVGEEQDVQVIQRSTGIECTKMTNAWAAYLSAIIAEHYCCKAFRNHHKGAKKVEIGLVGLEGDLEISEKIFKYAYNCVEAQCKRIRAEHKQGWPASNIREMTNAYGFGFCRGLMAAYKAQDQEHQDWGLVLVTPQAVVDAVSKMGKPSPYGAANDKGWRRNFADKGYEDGQKFDPSRKLESQTSKSSAFES